MSKNVDDPPNNQSSTITITLTNRIIPPAPWANRPILHRPRPLPPRVVMTLGIIILITHRNYQRILKDRMIPTQRVMEIMIIIIPVVAGGVIVAAMAAAVVIMVMLIMAQQT